eukprot:8413883-Heterocapsa_arctica.AAC.1
MADVYGISAGTHTPPSLWRPTSPRSARNGGGQAAKTSESTISSCAPPLGLWSTGQRHRLMLLAASSSSTRTTSSAQ